MMNLPRGSIRPVFILCALAAVILTADSDTDEERSFDRTVGRLNLLKRIGVRFGSDSSQGEEIQSSHR
jgi:hypothetical protein